MNLMQDETPHYKMKNKGRVALSNAELISLVSGESPKKKSIELAKTALDGTSGNLSELGRMTLTELMNKGYSERQAIRIQAAFELSKRTRSQETLVRSKIAGSRDVFEFIHEDYEGVNYELFFAIFMNRANRVLGKVRISEGGISGTVADPKKIFKMALDYKASSMILSHNHPSGNCQPSEADIQLTRKLKEAGQLLDLPVLDHIIYGDKDTYYSFADEGLI